MRWSTDQRIVSTINHSMAATVPSSMIDSISHRS
jgi:hypothetical protein